MNVTIEKCDDELIAALAGEIDHHNSKQIREAIDAELERGGYKLLTFDLESVSFMDSSGIGMMIGRCKNMDFTGGEVRAEHMNGRIRKIFLLSGLHKMVKIEEGGEEE